MRGKLVSPLRFYSTYEELKQRRSTSYISYEYSFYSTYEELKLKRIKYTEFQPVSFYSTYEELKLGFATLPKTWEVQFLQYLWGIETS